MANSPDILENDILKISPDILGILLKDHSVSHFYKTERNIIWATNDYRSLGEEYSFHKEIKQELITGENGLVIRPRAHKDAEEQRKRIIDKAEVFTPAWICNKQNNLVDNAWFERENVFNTEIDETGSHAWIVSKDPIQFPNIKRKTWRDYVRAPRLEVACGEAPYLVSRYDTTTCDNLIAVPQRIGLFDRKLRVVNENTTTPDEWLVEAFNALHNTYGFEWQGDNLLLAREAVLYTFIEHYQYKFGDKLAVKTLKNAAYIISWNLWQMDGVKCVVPNSCHNDVTIDLFGEETVTECPACNGKGGKHNGISCWVVEWKDVTTKEPSRIGTKNKTFLYPDLKKQVPIPKRKNNLLNS
ncbi:MAG: restriction endonuclease subunit M [Paludibacteraceae bacterium]|nr:restriction endonuclease subunit M [Paludibacteraceae bacterium]